MCVCVGSCPESLRTCHRVSMLLPPQAQRFPRAWREPRAQCNKDPGVCNVGIIWVNCNDLNQRPKPRPMMVNVRGTIPFYGRKIQVSDIF